MTTQAHPARCSIRAKLTRIGNTTSAGNGNMLARFKGALRSSLMSDLRAVCPLGPPHLRAQAKTLGFKKKVKENSEPVACRDSLWPKTQAIRPRVCALRTNRPVKKLRGTKCLRTKRPESLMRMDEMTKEGVSCARRSFPAAGS